MGFVLRMLLWVALAGALLGSRCGEAEAVPSELWRQDVAPAFDYGLYSDAHGRLQGETSGVLLVHRSEHLERVYADAREGNARAQVLVQQLEQATRAAGEGLAEQALSLGCTAMPTCTVKWAELGELIPSRGPGGVRLKQLLAQGFAARARFKHMENTVITVALNVLLVGGAAMAIEGRVAQGEAAAEAEEAAKLGREAAAEVRAVLPEAESALALEEAAALEARLQEAEALEEGGRTVGSAGGAGAPAAIGAEASARSGHEQPGLGGVRGVLGAEVRRAGGDAPEGRRVGAREAALGLAQLHPFPRTLSPGDEVSEGHSEDAPGASPST